MGGWVNCIFQQLSCDTQAVKPLQAAFSKRLSPNLYVELFREKALVTTDGIGGHPVCVAHYLGVEVPTNSNYTDYPGL